MTGLFQVSTGEQKRGGPTKVFDSGLLLRQPAGQSELLVWIFPLSPLGASPDKRSPLFLGCLHIIKVSSLLCLLKDRAALVWNVEEFTVRTRVAACFWFLWRKFRILSSFPRCEYQQTLSSGVISTCLRTSSSSRKRTSEKAERQDHVVQQPR